MKSLKANNLMNLLSVERKGHGIDEWIRRETLKGFTVGKNSGFVISLCVTQ